MLSVNPPALNTIDHTDEVGANDLRPGSVFQREQTAIHAHAVTCRRRQQRAGRNEKSPRVNPKLRMID